jgi:hypothetical protein
MFTPSRSSTAFAARCLTAALALGAVLPACADPSSGGTGIGDPSGAGAGETPVAAFGVLEVPLTATSASGDAYRLVGAQFDITGPGYSELVDDQPDSLVIARSVPVGAYDVTLQGRYHLEKNVDGVWTTVPAVLISPNPQTGLAVASEQTTQAIFRFRTRENGEEIEFAPGTLEIVLEVEPAGDLCGAGEACLTGAFTVTQDLPVVNGVESTGAFAHLVGQPVTFGVSFDLGPFVQDPAQIFGRCVRAAVSGTQVAFAGDETGFLQDTFGPQLAGAVTQLSFCSDGIDVRFNAGNFADVPSQWGLEITDGPAGVDVPLDFAGYPVPQSLATPGTVMLRKYDPFSDFATGGATLTLFLP